MKVYLAEENFVFTVRGGRFYKLDSPPKAIFSIKRPVPTKLWTVPEIKDTTLITGEVWFINTEIREFLCDERKVYILNFKHCRYEPGYCTGEAEFFVTEEYVKEKIESFKKTHIIEEFHWDDSVGTWKKVHQRKYYRKV